MERPELTGISAHAIEHFCRKWGVARLWLFGSFAKGTARAESDVDVLVEFLTETRTSTWDWPQMEDELEAIFGRSIDLLSTGILRNPFRRKSIEATRKLLYAA